MCLDFLHEYECAWWVVGGAHLRKRFREQSSSVSVLEWDVCVWEDGELSVGHVGSRDGQLVKVRQEQRLNVNNTYLRLTNTH